MATALDWLIFTAAMAPALVGAVQRSEAFLPTLADFSGVSSAISLVAGIAWLTVTLRLMQRNGQSIAKRVFSIKVVRTDGSAATLARLFWLRNVVNLLPTLIPVVGDLYELVDALMIYGATRQCLHDKLADTIVVKA